MVGCRFPAVAARLAPAPAGEARQERGWHGAAARNLLRFAELALWVVPTSGQKPVITDEFLSFHLPSINVLTDKPSWE